MVSDKKKFEIIILSIALGISVILNVELSSLYINYPDIPIPEELNTLRVGKVNRPYDLDPVASCNRESKHIIEQVCEGLYMHNLSDPNLGIVPRLASDYGTWNPTGTKFTVSLRRNVYFHDGKPFNADAVKWNFERICWFTNGTGTLNTTISPILPMWLLPNGTLFLEPNNPVTINNHYSVTINLRAPYSILESLLCSPATFILSPESTPKYDYISTENDKIVGTGPFVYDYLTVGTEIKFHRWERYWRTGSYFEKLAFYLFDTSTSLNQAVVDHSVDYIFDSLSCVFCIVDPYSHYTSHRVTRGLSYYYLSMNNNKINKTWRQAISYAINYTYIVKELQDGTAYKSNGPLAPIFSMYDPIIKAPIWNLAKARQILVDAGITNLTVNNDTSGPIANAWRAADFKAWNYSYNIGNNFREDLGVLLRYNLDLIGIEFVDHGMSYDDYISRAYGYLEPGGYNSLELFWVGWSPDYFSPYNMIAPLFSNQSGFNSAQYYNHTVEMWLNEVLSETNSTKRAELYSKILHQIIEVDMPHAFGYHPFQPFTHSLDLRGVPYNPMGSFYALPMYRDSNS